ncbi:MAG: dTDP-4-dehydrorhamnose 3,5-epimerase [Glaciecola sp.]|jgi:dTDP-4-dehydrorhamnose 3,5-epimerase
MEVQETKLKGCFILEPKVFKDNRGYFVESFNKSVFKEKTGVDTDFVQDNQSSGSYGTIRGLHSQTGEHAQAKLVRVLEGEVLDIAVDIRPESPTYLQHVAVILSADNMKQLFIPKGFLHGFAVLSEKSTFFYKCDNLYNKESELGVVYNDQQFDIDWIIPEDQRVLSEKDLQAPTYQSL